MKIIVTTRTESIDEEKIYKMFIDDDQESKFKE